MDKKRKGCLREKKQNKTKQEKSGGEQTVTGGGALRSRGEEEEESGRDKLMELKAARKRQTYTSQRERQKRSQEERVERN